MSAALARLTVVVALSLLALVALAVRPYGGNPSSMLRISTSFASGYDLPRGLGVFAAGGSDGQLFHQIARELPAFARGEAPGPVRGEVRDDRAYRWQRILLPVVAWSVAWTGALGGALGDAHALPRAIVAVNLVAVVGALLLFGLATGRAGVHAASVALSPAALIGLLFSTAEPLSLLLVAAALLAWQRAGRRVGAWPAALWALAALAREVNAIVPLAFALDAARKRRWRDAVLAVSSLAPLACWHLVLMDRFGASPLRPDQRTLGLPFGGVAAMLGQLGEHGAEEWSSLAFLVAFAAPLALLLARDAARVARCAAPALAAALMLALLFVLRIEVWVAITAVGRVLPALYPMAAFVASEADTPAWRALSLALCAVGVVAAVGVATSVHPFRLS